MDNSYQHQSKKKTKRILIVGKIKEVDYNSFNHLSSPPPHSGRSNMNQNLTQGGSTNGIGNLNYESNNDVPVKNKATELTIIPFS